MRRVAFDLSTDEARVLALLDEGLCARAHGEGMAVRALRELVDRVMDGATRPGSWERQWLVQAFGPGVERLDEATEPDPAASWRRRLRDD